MLKCLACFVTFHIFSSFLWTGAKRHLTHSNGRRRESIKFIAKGQKKLRINCQIEALLESWVLSHEPWRGKRKYINISIKIVWSIDILSQEQEVEYKLIELRSKNQLRGKIFVHLILLKLCRIYRLLSWAIA